MEQEGGSKSEDGDRNYIKESLRQSEDEELKREHLDIVEDNLSTHQSHLFDMTTPTSISNRMFFQNKLRLSSNRDSTINFAIEDDQSYLPYDDDPLANQINEIGQEVMQNYQFETAEIKKQLFSLVN